MFRPYFEVHCANVTDKARAYAAGLLMQSPAKNMERMEEYVAGYDYQAQQQFITDSPWKHAPLMERVASEVGGIVGGEESALVIDETAFAKQGKMSVGVKRQWNGRLGKVDNCQVGVFAVLSNGKRGAFVDYRLYLPEDWTEDADRCEKASVPKDEREFKTKSQLALDMVDAARAQSLNFGWLLADGGYGKEPSFLRELDNRGVRFAVDIHKDQAVYESEPELYLPRRKNGKGRKYTKKLCRTPKVRVDKIFDALTKREWSKHFIRHTTRGRLNVMANARRVWVREDEDVREFWLVCAQFPETGDTKYFLSNADADTPLSVLLRKHAVRYWVERSFQDAKGAVGMADYQVRGWNAWHHHMAMVSLAMLFMLREREVHMNDVKLLSCNDVVELLTAYLPRITRTPQNVLENIRRRHRKRQAAIDSAIARQKANPAELEP